MTWTKRLADDPYALEALLQPENEGEAQLLTIPEFRGGLLWGEPRFGHPEGRLFEGRDFREELVRALVVIQRRWSRCRLLLNVDGTCAKARRQATNQGWSGGRRGRRWPARQQPRAKRRARRYRRAPLRAKATWCRMGVG